MKKVMLVLLVGILLAGCSSAPITRVIAFGSDFSDNGNYFRLVKEGMAKGQIPPGQLIVFDINWQGRDSNGPVAVEILADRLKASLSDYAVAAAMSGQENYYSWEVLKNSGLLGQIDKYETELNGKQGDSSALFYLEISGGDFTTGIYLNRNLSDQAITDLSDLQIANLTTAITHLAKLGAKQFLVVSVDWSNFPAYAIGAPFFDMNPIDQGIVDRSTKFLSHKKSTLPGTMEKLASQLNVKIMVFDTAAAEGPIRSNPAQYGFTNMTDPCTFLPYSGGGCTAPDQYYYWGYYYLTAHAHQILGEAMAAQLSK